MKKRYMLLMFGICVVIFLIFNDSKGSMSMEEPLEDIFDIKLEYSEDKNIFKNDLLKYIDLIDNSLFAMSSFNMSNNLNENYDFLTNFAISLILNNESNYNDEIIYEDDYKYVDVLGNEYVTNKYVREELIYDITDSVFNKSNYMIINEHLNVVDNLVPLLLVKDNISFMEIEEIIDIVKFSDEYKVYVKYRDMDMIYVYKFLNIDGIFYIVNVDVEE